MKALILAGGSGTRLWPLSRKNYPKQFLKLHTSNSLLQETVQRMLRGFQSPDLIVMTNGEYKFHVLSDLAAITDQQNPVDNIILEPVGRNTAPAIALPKILESMGCEVTPLYCDPDGKFPNHHPDPTVVEYIRDLISTTKEKKADIGIGYDGDADRIGVIDSRGNIIWGDQIMIILSRDILKRKPGSVFIGDVKCSQLMFDDIEKHGGRPVMWKTGHSLVKSKMKEEHAVLAGEFSGHIFIADDYFGFDDALYTSFRLIEIMKKTGLGIHELLSDIPRLFYTPEIRLECQDDQKKALVEKIVNQFKEYSRSGKGPFPIKKIYDIDGARIVFEKGWGLVRSSNTQPVIVMRFEAEDEESLKQYRSFLESELKNAMERG